MNEQLHSTLFFCPNPLAWICFMYIWTNYTRLVAKPKHKFGTFHGFSIQYSDMAKCFFLCYICDDRTITYPIIENHLNNLTDCRFVFFFFSLVAKKWLNICEMENNIPSTLLKPQVTLALWRSALWWRLMQRHHSYGWLWQDSAREAYETLHWRKSPSSLQEVLQRVITRLLPILDEQQN